MFSLAAPNIDSLLTIILFPPPPRTTLLCIPTNTAAAIPYLFLRGRVGLANPFSNCRSYTTSASLPFTHCLYRKRHKYLVELSKLPASGQSIHSLLTFLFLLSLPLHLQTLTTFSPDLVPSILTNTTHHYYALPSLSPSTAAPLRA
jgi:hypothetical protein